MSTENILKEGNDIQSFIKKWQEKNPYKPTDLKYYNSKFKKEFNEFLKSTKNNFSKETIDLFIVK